MQLPTFSWGIPGHLEPDSPSSTSPAIRPIPGTGDHLILLFAYINNERIKNSSINLGLLQLECPFSVVPSFALRFRGEICAGKAG